MSETPPTATFERESEVAAQSPTLIEGLPGLGMVASIAVDRIADQLELDYHGHIQSETTPSVAAFDEGRVRNAVRVYSGTEPAIMTLQSDIPIPEEGYEPLSRCVHTELAEEFEQAIFLAGAAAESEEQVGEVTGVATSDRLETALHEAGIALASESGAIGGVTGALLARCYANDVDAAALIVRCDPRMPDPGAARSVIEDALEPLVEFDIDTSELEERAETIQEQKQQVAQQLQQLQQGGEGPLQSETMYQ